MHDLATLVALNNAACDKAKEQRIDACRAAMLVFTRAFLARLAHPKDSTHTPGNWIDEAISLTESVREAFCESFGVSTIDADMNADWYGDLLTPIYRTLERVDVAAFHKGYAQRS